MMANSEHQRKWREVCAQLLRHAEWEKDQALPGLYCPFCDGDLCDWNTRISPEFDFSQHRARCWDTLEPENLGSVDDEEFVASLYSVRDRRAHFDPIWNINPRLLLFHEGLWARLQPDVRPYRWRQTPETVVGASPAAGAA